MTDQNEGKRTSASETPRTPSSRHPPEVPDDEISLFDLWLVLMRHRMLMLLVAGGVFLGFLVFGLMRSDIYRITYTLEIGSHIVDSEETLLEQPESVKAKLEKAYVPKTIAEWRSQNEGVAWMPSVTVNASNDAPVVSMEAKAPLNRLEVYRDLFDGATQRLISDQKRLLATIRAQLETELSRARDALQSIHDDIAELETRLQRLDTREKLTRQEITDLESSIEEAEGLHRAARRDQLSPFEAMSLLMVSNEVRQARQRLSSLRDRLQVGLPNKRTTIKTKIADQKRELAAQKAEIASIEARLSNLSKTRALSEPQRSPDPVGTSTAVMAVVGAVLGLVLGLLAAFLAEFVSRAREYAHEQV